MASGSTVLGATSKFKTQYKPHKDSLPTVAFKEVLSEVATSGGAYIVYSSTGASLAANAYSEFAGFAESVPLSEVVSVEAGTAFGSVAGLVITGAVLGAVAFNDLTKEKRLEDFNTHRVHLVDSNYPVIHDYPKNRLYFGEYQYENNDRPTPHEGSNTVGYRHARKTKRLNQNNVSFSWSDYVLGGQNSEFVNNKSDFRYAPYHGFIDNGIDSGVIPHGKKKKRKFPVPRYTVDPNNGESTVDITSGNPDIVPVYTPGEGTHYVDTRPKENKTRVPYKIVSSLDRKTNKLKPIISNMLGYSTQSDNYQDQHWAYNPHDKGSYTNDPTHQVAIGFDALHGYLPKNHMNKDKSMFLSDLKGGVNGPPLYSTDIVKAGLYSQSQLSFTDHISTIGGIIGNLEGDLNSLLQSNADEDKLEQTILQYVILQHVMNATSKSQDPTNSQDTINGTQLYEELLGKDAFNYSRNGIDNNAIGQQYYDRLHTAVSNVVDKLTNKYGVKDNTGNYKTGVDKSRYLNWKLDKVPMPGNNKNEIRWMIPGDFGIKQSAHRSVQISQFYDSLDKVLKKNFKTGDKFIYDGGVNVLGSNGDTLAFDIGIKPNGHLKMDSTLARLSYLDPDEKDLRNLVGGKIPAYHTDAFINRMTKLINQKDDNASSQLAIAISSYLLHTYQHLGNMPFYKITNPNTKAVLNVRYTNLNALYDEGILKGPRWIYRKNSNNATWIDNNAPTGDYVDMYARYNMVARTDADRSIAYNVAMSYADSIQELQGNKVGSVNEPGFIAKKAKKPRPYINGH